MENKLYSKIYLWLFLGLLVSFLTGYFVSTNVNMLFNLIKPGYVIGILIIEVFIAIFLSARITKMQPMTAKILYFVYSFTTGLSLSFVFVVYEITSIIYVFAVTSLLFGIFAFIGKVTKLDLSKISTSGAPSFPPVRKAGRIGSASNSIRSRRSSGGSAS